MAIDLHMHSTASDGTDPPQSFGELAVAAGLSAIALTDHDTIAGLGAAQASCKAAGVEFVPGIELSTERGRPRGALHMLGYFIDPTSPRLGEVIDVLTEARSTRNPQIIEALNEVGVDITLEEVLDEAGGATVGRPHIAAVLVRKAYAKSIQDAFKRYIGVGGAAYRRKQGIHPAVAIDALHAAGGLAVLAHPVQLRCEDDEDLERTIGSLAKLGLDGLEAWHSDHTPAQVKKYCRIAERYDLLLTGGSDYHGRRKSIQMGKPIVDDQVLAALREAAQRRVQ
ncbi:PHP domain-containing protein [Planctomycetales bacterium ZRK34]|nr:PHP domain-containing protein [Planctomycetales bacterium ZRK34]